MAACLTNSPGGTTLGADQLQGGYRHVGHVFDAGMHCQAGNVRAREDNAGRGAGVSRRRGSLLLAVIRPDLCKSVEDPIEFYLLLGPSALRLRNLTRLF